jgi:hypothetical protein
MPMLTVTGRTLFMCAAIVLAALTSHPATAELPQHLLVDRFAPEGQDFPAEFRDIQFGEAVAIRNGIAFIGMPKARDGGHVAVLNLTTSGWRRVATIKAPAADYYGKDETQFGRRLVFRDGVLVVGGHITVYVFRRDGNGIWTFRQSMRAPTWGPVVEFPGALRYEAGELFASALRGPFYPSLVFGFDLQPDGRFFWRHQLEADFFPNEGGPGDNFGADMSMTKRALVVGSPRGSTRRSAGLPAYDRPGAAYIFRRHDFQAGTIYASHLWIAHQKLVPSEPAPGFGTSVAIDRDMIIVGAPKVDIEGLPAGPATPDGHNAGGAAYVFLPSAHGYVESLKLRPRPDELFKYQDFGYRVAMMGPHVEIAAVRPYGSDGLFPFGLVVTYTRDGTSLLPRGIAKGHVVAASMGLANNWLLMGVPYERSCPSAGCVGSAHIYDVNRFAP